MKPRDPKLRRLRTPPSFCTRFSLDVRYRQEGGVNNLTGISELQEKWITPDKLYGAISTFVFCPHLRPWFRGTLRCHFAVKVQKCFVDSDASPDFFFYYWMNCCFKSTFDGARPMIPWCYKAVTYWLTVYLHHKQFTDCSYYFSREHSL